MTPSELRRILNSGRLHKPAVEDLVQKVLDAPVLVAPLLQEVFLQDVDGVFTASWVFDHVMRKDIRLILPVIDAYVKGLDQLQSESCMRPMAHSCQMIAIAYFKERKPDFLERISKAHLEQMATVCFDWLIRDYKVATKVFAMTALFYLGEEFDWIRPELRSILELHIGEGSAGFQNRGGKILKKLKHMGY